MPQVTVPPVTAKKLQTLLFVHSSDYNSAFAYYSMGISLVLDQLTNYEGNCHKRTCSKWYCAGPGVSVLTKVGFEQMLKLPMNLLVFLKLFITSVLVLD